MPKPLLPARYRPDWLMVGAVSAALLAVTSLPAALGLARQTPQLAYTGARWFSPQDAPVYYSWIRQAAEGEWLLSNRFTAEAQEWGTLNTYWVAVGKLAAVLSLPPWVAFAVARLVTIPLLVLAVDWLASRLLPLRERRWAVVLAAFASGAGWLLLPWLNFSVDPATGVAAVPVDLWVPEASLVHTALHSGHLAASVAVLALSLGTWAYALASGRPRAAAAAGLWAVLLFSFHPFEAVLVGSVVVASAAVVGWRRSAQPWLAAGLWALVASPPVLYHVVTLASDPLIAARASQNVTLSPPLWTWPWALGVLGVLAGVGAADRWRRRAGRHPESVVLLAWALAQLVAAYLPLPFQRRLLIGLPVVLALLAAPVAARAAGWLVARLRVAAVGWAAVTLIFAVTLAPSTGWVLWHDLKLVAGRHPAVFADRSLLAALAWLEARTPKSAVVLAPPAWGGRVPAWAGRTTVVGHPIETVDADAKALLALRYFAGTLEAGSAEAFLRQQRVTHVVAPRGTGFVAGAGLTQVFANPATVIYAVAPPR